MFAPLGAYASSSALQSISVLKIDGKHFEFLGFGLVLLTPARGFFIRPFAVAGDDGRYFCIMFGSLRNGIPLSWSFCAASMMVVIGALKMLDACILAGYVCTVECTGC